MSLALHYIFDGKDKVYFYYNVLVDGELKEYTLFDMRESRWRCFLDMLNRLIKTTDKYSDFKELHKFMEAVYEEEGYPDETYYISKIFPTEEKLLRFAHAWTDALSLKVYDDNPDALESEYYDTWEYYLKKEMLFLRDVLLFKQDPITEQGILYKDIHFYKDGKYICSTSSTIIQPIFDDAIRIKRTVLGEWIKDIIFANIYNKYFKRAYPPIIKNENVRSLIKSLNQTQYPSMNRVYDLTNYLKTKEDYLDFKKILHNDNNDNNEEDKNNFELEFPKLGKRINKLGQYEIEIDMFLTGVNDLYVLSKALIKE